MKTLTPTIINTSSELSELAAASVTLTSRINRNDNVEIKAFLSQMNGENGSISIHGAVETLPLIH